MPADVCGEYLEGFSQVEDQIGAVFLVNGKVVCMDAFGKAATLSLVFKNLLESYDMDGVDRFEKETDAGTGKKSGLGRTRGRFCGQG
jgi:hypothetical protein